MTIAELKEQYEKAEQSQNAAWDKYQAALTSVEPFKQQWHELYGRANRLKQRIEIQQEIEAEKAKPVSIYDTLQSQIHQTIPQPPDMLKDAK